MTRHDVKIRKKANSILLLLCGKDLILARIKKKVVEMQRKK